MQTYTDKLRELGVEALEENKDAIKKAIADSQIEIIKKAPQLLEKVMEAVFSECECGDEEDE
jgi:hypothetical protein